MTALHCASSEGHTDVVEVLLNHNADIDAINKVKLNKYIVHLQERCISDYRLF